MYHDFSPILRQEEKILFELDHQWACMPKKVEIYNKHTYS